jgi:ribosomal protein S12 methylthiotransferase accessory factor YcaO
VVFEAWLHGDAGAFFVAGTTDVVAVRDGGVTALEGTTDDEALLDALSAVGLSKAAVRPAQAVRAATSAVKRR